MRLAYDPKTDSLCKRSTSAVETLGQGRLQGIDLRHQFAVDVDANPLRPDPTRQ
jgi:hypothetical protein